MRHILSRRLSDANNREADQQSGQDAYLRCRRRCCCHGWLVDGTPSEHSVQGELDKVAAKLNQSVPMPLDRDTELTNATAEEGVLIYNYRLLNFAAADVPPDVLTQRVKPLATNHACATPDTRKALLDQGVTLRYRYYDKEKVYVGEFDVDSADCR